MILLDANVLLYAYDRESPHHKRAAAWLERLFESQETVGFAWITLWAFLRISTTPRLLKNPRSPTQGFALIKEWLAQPGVVLVQPGERYAAIFEDAVTRSAASGPLITDAALAALAIENGATLASTDRDFSRFQGLRWVNPLS